jgi:hypothetical protein
MILDNIVQVITDAIESNDQAVPNDNSEKLQPENVPCRTILDRAVHENYITQLR